MCKKLNKAGWKLAWLSKDLLLNLRSKGEMRNQWKQGYVNWEEYRDMVQMSKDGIRKPKENLEQDLATDMKNNKEGSYKFTGRKRKYKDSLPHDTQAG